MKPSEPLGDASWGPLFVRVSLGTYFILAGLAKLEDVFGFVAEVQKFDLLPKEFATVFGIMLPYLEIIFGTLFLIGMWTTVSGIVLAILLLSFIYAFGFFSGNNFLFNKDTILLAATMCVLYTGAGALSIDRFRKQG